MVLQRLTNSYRRANPNSVALSVSRGPQRRQPLAQDTREWLDAELYPLVPLPHVAEGASRRPPDAVAPLHRAGQLPGDLFMETLPHGKLTATTWHPTPQGKLAIEDKERLALEAYTFGGATANL